MNGYIEGSDLTTAEEILMDIERASKRLDPREISVLRKFIGTLKEDIQKLEEIIARNQR